MYSHDFGHLCFGRRIHPDKTRQVTHWKQLRSQECSIDWTTARLLRLDDASVRVGTLGERHGATARSSEKKKRHVYSLWEHASKLSQVHWASDFSRPCTHWKRCLWRVPVESFKSSVQNNVKVITSEGQFHLTAHQSCRQLLVPRSLQTSRDVTKPGNQLLSNTSARGNSRIRGGRLVPWTRDDYQWWSQREDQESSTSCKSRSVMGKTKTAVVVRRVVTIPINTSPCHNGCWKRWTVIRPVMVKKN